MKSLHIITPVKDSIDTTIDTVKAIMSSDIKVPFTYTIYNDFSTPENTQRLEKASKEYGFQLVNLSDLTDHPSPNYLLVLQKTQKEAIEADAGLLIVESDVTVQKLCSMVHQNGRIVAWLLPLPPMKTEKSTSLTSMPRDASLRCTMKRSVSVSVVPCSHQRS